MVADNFLIDFLEYITNPTGIVPWTLIIFSVLFFYFLLNKRELNLKKWIAYVKDISPFFVPLFFLYGSILNPPNRSAFEDLGFLGYYFDFYELYEYQEYFLSFSCLILITIVLYFLSKKILKILKSKHKNIAISVVVIFFWYLSAQLIRFVPDTFLDALIHSGNMEYFFSNFNSDFYFALLLSIIFMGLAIIFSL